MKTASASASASASAFALLLLCSATASAQTVPDIVTTLVGPAELQVGRSGRWVLSLRNQGYAYAAAVRATVVLPAGSDLDRRISLTYPNGYRAVPTNCSYAVTSRTLTCRADNVAVGETRSFTIDVQGPAVPANLAVQATASVVQGTPELQTGNNSATANTLVSHFMPAIGFPTSTARLWLCQGKRELLECPTTAGYPLALDAQGQNIQAGVVRMAAAVGPGTLTLQLFNASGVLTSSFALTPYSSRCYQGPMAHNLGDPYPYEGRVCY